MPEPMTESISQVLFGLDSVAARPIPIDPPPPQRPKRLKKRSKSSSTTDNKLLNDEDLVSDNSDNEVHNNHGDVTEERTRAKKKRLNDSIEGHPPQKSLVQQEPAEKPTHHEDPAVEAKRLQKQRAKKVKALLKKRYSDDEMSRTIVLTNLPVTTKRREIQGILGIPSDDLDSIRFRNVPLKEEFKEKRKIGALQRKFAEDGRGMTAFVVLKNAEHINKYLALTGKELNDGRHIFINVLKQSDEFSIFDRRNTIFVGRLPHNFLEENLYNTFKAYGSVANVRIVRDAVSGESKCFGYVCFQNRASVDEALKGAKNRMVDGHPLRVLRCLKEIDMQAKMAEKRARQREQLERQKKKLGETYDMSSMSKCKQRKLLRYGPERGSMVKVQKTDRKAEASRRSRVIASSNEKVVQDLKRKIVKQNNTSRK